MYSPLWVNIQSFLKQVRVTLMPEKAKYVCENCGEECGSKVELDKHMEIYHTKKAAGKKK